MPESYREPLILFYREDQSVAEVAGALKLSEDAVKQRLLRGREMLRKQTADLVESRLRRSRPGRTFTAGVMAGLVGQSAGNQERRRGGFRRHGRHGRLRQGSGLAADARVCPGVADRPVRRMVRHMGERQAAPTQQVHDATLDAGRRMMRFSVAFAIGIFALAFAPVVGRST